MTQPKIANYEFRQQIGKGAIGSVWAASYGGHEALAVKVFHPGRINGILLTDVLSRLFGMPAHPGIITYYDFNFEGTPAYITTDMHASTIQSESGPRLQPRSLRSLCGRVPTTEEAWRYIYEIMDAMAHAHRHRIVHCNLKPSNILLSDDHPADVKLTDFCQGVVGGVPEPDPGDSIYYAAPEQLRSPEAMLDGCAERWDVYAFGVVAFVLLNGKLPRLNRFIDELRRKIAAGEPAEITMEALAEEVESEEILEWPPSSDGDLQLLRERLITRCLETDPLRRFADMRDVEDAFRQLEEDAEHSLTEKALAEERRGLEERIGGARRKVLAIGVFAAAATLAAGFFFWKSLQTSGQTTVKTEYISPVNTPTPAVGTKARSTPAEELAPPAPPPIVVSDEFAESLKESQEALDHVFSTLVERNAVGEPLYSVPPQALGSVLNYYEDFIERHGDDPKMRLETGRAYNNSGEIRLVLGDRQRALDDFDRALAGFKALLSEDPENGSLMMLCAFSLQNLAEAQDATSRPKAAAESSTASLELYNRLAERNPGSDAAARAVARSLVRTARRGARLGRNAQAAIHFDRVIAILDKIKADGREVSDDIALRATADYERAPVEKALGSSDEAIDRLIDSADAFLALSKAEPGIPDYRFQLAKAYSALAELVASKGESADAVIANRESVDLLVELIRENPEQRGYRFLLARRYGELSDTLDRWGKKDEAKRNLQAAVILLQDLVKVSSQNTEYTVHLARLQGRQIETRAITGEAALTTANAMVKSLQDLVVTDLDPENNDAKRPAHRYALAAAYVNLAKVQLGTGRKDLAAACFEKAINHWQAVANADTSDPTVATRLADAQAQLEKLQ